MGETDDPVGGVTRTPRQMAAGDEDARRRVYAALYDEIGAAAGRVFARHGRERDSLQTTALIHEAFVKLAGAQPVDWQGRSYLLDVSARAMRQVPVDHHRARTADVRGGDRARIPLDDLADAYERRSEGLGVSWYSVLTARRPSCWRSRPDGTGSLRQEPTDNSCGLSAAAQEDGS